MSSEAGSVPRFTPPAAIVDGYRGGLVGVQVNPSPHLPADVAAMVAPSITVTAATAVPREDRPRRRSVRRYLSS